MMQCIDRIWLTGILSILLSATPAGAENHALLIGVGAYTSVTPLEGPRYDIDALRKVLTAQWDFKEKNIVSVVDGDATRARILQEIRRLKDRTRPGDMVFLYFSGHGTSSSDPNAQLPMEAHSGALVPVDFRIEGTPEQIVQGLVVGRRDLRPLLNDLDQGDRKVFVAFDACYSGNAVRSLYRALLTTRPLPARYIALNSPSVPTRAMTGSIANDIGAFGSNTYKGDSYPYRNVYYLAAASEFEQARDIGSQDMGHYSTVDNQPHGAFTDALLRVLTQSNSADTDHDGHLTFGEVYRSIADFMRQRQYGHTPQALPTLAQDTQGLAGQSVFPHSSQPSPPVNAATATALRIQLAADSASLRQSLGQLPGVALVEERPELLIKREANTVLLLTAAGDLLARLEAATDQQVIQRIRQQARIKKLTETSNPEQRFNISLALTRLAATDSRISGGASTSLGGVALEGDKISFAVRSEQQAHLLLIDIDPLGGVHVLYPYDEGELQPLPAGQLVEIPGKQPNDWIEVTPPFGTEYVLAFAFTSLPEEVKGLMGRNLPPDSPLLEGLERLLTTPAKERAQANLQLITAKRTAVQ